jgi:hypothetical protein
VKWALPFTIVNFIGQGGVNRVKSFLISLWPCPKYLWSFATLTAIKFPRRPSVNGNVRRLTALFAGEMPDDIGTAEPYRLDLHHGGRLGLAEMNDDRTCLGPVANSLAIAAALDGVSFQYRNPVPRLSGLPMPGDVLRIDAGKTTFPEPINDGVDGLFFPNCPLGFVYG